MEKQELPQRKAPEPEDEDKVIKEKEKQKHKHPTRQRKLSIQIPTTEKVSQNAVSPIKPARSNSISSSKSTVSVRQSDIKLSKYDEKSAFAISATSQNARRHSIKKQKVATLIEEANENEETGPQQASVDELKHHLKNYVKEECANETERLLHLYTISLAYLFGISLLLLVLSSINIFLPFDSNNQLTSHVAFDTIMLVFLVLIAWMGAYFKDAEFYKKILKAQRFQNLRNGFIEKEIAELNYTIAQNAL
ncbi:Oidioi.mRNA.OKI2018_I69.PAR.g9253.t1.cds [Oikopleura dioica]|uniref:Oidioi.mRNA.OKI2018_I69.PAR.g9253.t1.cds n=1 Tax=Oikopleura dioica TaxID=34765 RepID=A0ABN7RNB9_OIKDI|nr:Oidioi.mRNA.OKI2018_I69.PAR.g9253.t1.cds [Oikopleura dioica]